MIKPEMPNIPNMPNIPGMGAMTETLDFMKKMWGGMGMPGMNMPGMNMPGMVMPTLSVEEINKKISDLKAVESWLTLNMNMLRGTIQALEVQSATISTLQTMGENFTHSMTPPRAPESESPAAASAGQGDGHHKSHETPQPTSQDESDAAKLTAPLVNAAAWWNMLQDQFKQAVSSAMTNEGAATPSAPKTKPKARPAASSSPSSAAASPRKRKTTK